MRNWGLQTRDAFTLSFTKFRTRRIRTVLTLISTSVLALILVVCSSVLTGLLKVASTSPQSKLTTLHLAQTFGTTTGPVIDGQGKPIEPKVTSVDEQRNQFRQGQKNLGGLRDIYVEVGTPQQYASEATLDLLAVKTDPTQNAFVFNPRIAGARSSALLQPYVAEGQSFTWSEGQPLPVVVSTKALVDAKASELDKIKDPQKRVVKRQEFEKALYGKTGTLSIIDHSAQQGGSVTFSETDGQVVPSADDKGPGPTVTTIPVKVVGFAPDSESIFNSGYSSNASYAIPFEVAQKANATKQLFTQVTEFYPSFDTKQNRNNYVSKSNGEASIYADIVETNKQYFKSIKRAYNIAVIVMLVLMAIPMAATMSKILADSQRETGVFRAIGARNRNIIAVYSLYILQLVVAAFLISLVVGLLLCVWINAKFATHIELTIADFGDTLVHVNLVRVNPMQLATIFAGLLAGSALGACIPMVRSLRRDPIKSLRDE